MANQPSKYSKFLLGAASAALVASAVAPVASAADFKDTKVTRTRQQSMHFLKLGSYHLAIKTVRSNRTKR